MASPNSAPNPGAYDPSAVDIGAIPAQPQGFVEHAVTGKPAMVYHSEHIEPALPDTFVMGLGSIDPTNVTHESLDTLGSISVGASQLSVSGLRDRLAVLDRTFFTTDAKNKRVQVQGIADRDLQMRIGDLRLQHERQLNQLTREGRIRGEAWAIPTPDRDRVISPIPASETTALNYIGDLNTRHDAIETAREDLERVRATEVHVTPDVFVNPEAAARPSVGGKAKGLRRFGLGNLLNKVGDHAVKSVHVEEAKEQVGEAKDDLAATQRAGRETTANMDRHGRNILLTDEAVRDDGKNVVPRGQRRKAIKKNKWSKFGTVMEGKARDAERNPPSP